MSTISTQDVTAIRNHIDNSFPFTVDKFPLCGPDNMRTDLYALFRSDNLENIGGAVKENYVPHTLEDIKALAEAAMIGFDGATLDCGWRNGHCLVISPSKDYRRTVYGTKDEIFPRGYIHAGFGGLKGLNGLLGVFRDTCKNLMRPKLAGKIVQANIKHTSGLSDKVDVLVGQFRTLMQSWNTLADHCVEMNRMDVPFATFLEKVFVRPTEVTERQAKSYNQRIQLIVERVQRERNLLGNPKPIDMVTAWEAYNGVQGYFQHDARRHGKPDYFVRAFDAFDSTEVDRAYDLALELAV